MKIFVTGILSAMSLLAVAQTAVEDHRWVLYELNGSQTLVVGRRESALTFNADDRKFGAFAGVNQMGGSYDLSGIKLKFGEIVSTKMAGPEDLMKQETEFSAALKKVTKAKVFGDRLVLYAGDVMVAKFKSSNSPLRP